MLRSLDSGPPAPPVPVHGQRGDNVWRVRWEEVAFLDVEADRTGTVLEVGAVCGERVVCVARNAEGRDALVELVEHGIVASHNLLAHDVAGAGNGDDGPLERDTRPKGEK